jgi:hypothetical protein
MPKNTHRALAAALLLAGSAIACAPTSKTEVRTTTSRSDNELGDRESVREETTTIRTDAPDTCDGVLSCTVDFAGEVIAFPFKLVGSLFGAIF